jgi:hypothetical protein
MRASTLNLPGIVGLDAAAAIRATQRDTDSAASPHSATNS